MRVDPVEITDDAKRIVDMYALHQVAGMIGKWMAVRYSEGSSDGIAYDSWKDARAHQPTFYQDLVFPIQIQHDSLSLDGAQRILNYWRKCFAAGFRAPDPDRKST